MGFARRAPWFALLAVLVAASVGSAVFDDFLPHTDDGCRVESHCLVCQRVQGSTSVVPSVLPLAVGLEMVGTAALPAPAVVLEVALRTADPRGPPLLTPSTASEV